MVDDASDARSFRSGQIRSVRQNSRNRRRQLRHVSMFAVALVTLAGLGIVFRISAGIGRQRPRDVVALLELALLRDGHSVCRSAHCRQC